MLTDHFNSNDQETVGIAFYYAISDNKVESGHAETSTSYLKSPITQRVCFVVRYIDIPCPTYGKCGHAHGEGTAFPTENGVP
jgi:hypothetical protein